MSHNQERWSRIWTTLNADSGTWGPRLFIVLPIDVHRNNNNDRIPCFRLYFLCEASYPNHVHLANHPGYDLDKPLEFFERFGHHTLTMLEMVKYGFSCLNYNVPGLGSGQILHCHHGGTPRHGLSGIAIALLAKQAISFVQQVNQTGSSINLLLSDRDALDVQFYLMPKDGHGRKYPTLQIGHGHTGDLFRNVEAHDRLIARWRCQVHASNANDIGPIIPSVAQSGGIINSPMSTITLRLMSHSDAMSLCSALQRTSHVFGANVTLEWSATSMELESLVMGLLRSSIRMLQIDGVMSFTHPQGCFDDKGDIFLSIIHTSTIQLLSLLNYPQRSTQYIYTRMLGVKHGLLLDSSPEHPMIDWSMVHEGMRAYTFGADLLTSDQIFRTRLRGLSEVLAQHSATTVKEIDLFSTTNNIWQGRLGVSNCVVYGLSRAIFPSKLFDSPSGLLRVVGCLLVRPQDLLDVLQFYALAEYTAPLEIETLLQEPEASSTAIATLYRCWNRPSHLRLTLVEKGRGVTTRSIASFEIWQARPLQNSIICLWWDEDGVSGRFWDAALLEAALRRFPTVLKRFTLDITDMTDRRLLRIQSVLQRSSLEQLHVQCKPILSPMYDHVEQILKSVQWSTIKSLVLSGDNIDSWLNLWTKHDGFFHAIPASEPHLLFLAIVGPTEKRNQFSHGAALVLHRLICLSPLLELWLENVQVEDGKDWDLIVEAIDFTTLRTAHTHNTSAEFTAKLNL